MESDFINVLYDISNETAALVTSVVHILMNMSYDGIQICTQIVGLISTITWHVYSLLSNLMPDLIQIFWVTIKLFIELSWEIFGVLASILHIGIESILKYISIEFLTKFLATGVLKLTELIQNLLAMGFGGLNVTFGLLLAAQFGISSVLLVFQKFLGWLFYQCLYAFRVIFYINLVILLITCLVLFILHSKFNLRFPQRMAGMLMKYMFRSSLAMFHQSITSLMVLVRAHFQNMGTRIQVPSECQHLLQFHGTSSNSNTSSVNQRTTSEFQANHGIASNSEICSTHISSSYNRLSNEIEVNRLLLELESEKDKSRCCICQDSIKDTILMPCRHFCVCDDCWRDVVRAGGRNAYCPLCRESVTNSIKIFS